MTTATQEPKKNFVTVYRSEGNYNYMKPSEDIAQYDFFISREDVPRGTKVNFLVDLEKDCIDTKEQTPLEIAKEIKEIYESYWIHTGIKDIELLIEYLESIEEEEAAAREAYELEYAKYQVAYWTERVNDLTHREG